MSVNTYPILFNSTLLGTSSSLIYTVPAEGSLQDLSVKLTNTDASAQTATVYAVAAITETSGAHDGAANASVLTDSSKAWTTNEWIGYKVKNLTDGSEAIITANTATTITGTLAGGTENDWDVSDAYEVVHAPLVKNQVIPATSIPANDYILVPVERLASGGEIHALSGIADKVTIQPIGGKIHTP